MAGAMFLHPASAQNNLDNLLAPRVTGVSPSDAYIGLSRMADGEIRHYNYGEHPGEYRPLYLSSRDKIKHMPCAQMEDSADCCSFGAIPPFPCNTQWRGWCACQDGRIVQAYSAYIKRPLV